MSKKDLCSALWGQIVQDTKTLANQVVSKILNKPTVPTPSRSVYQNHLQYNNVSYTSTVSLVNISNDSTTSLASSHSGTQHYNAVQEMTLQYETLWEVQLALGEIPGMFEGNILQPCLPLCPRQQQSSQQPESYLQYTIPLSSPSAFSEVNFEQPFDYYGDNEEDEDEQDYDDYEEEEEAEEEFLQQSHTSEIETQPNEIAPRPLLSRRQSSATNDLRHDRKDSGVFVHDDEEGIIHVSPKSRQPVDVSNESDISDPEAEDYNNDDYHYGYHCDYYFNNNKDLATQGRILSLRTAVMGKDALRMENGSFSFPLPSMMANIPSVSLQA
ncbi:hypothetical protein EDD21DRAFT_366203 [Dissophora ornata]|nr:hypothetical protein EDD21DRAFT_366203 [Dissophora ornata]